MFLFVLIFQIIDFLNFCIQPFYLLSNLHFIFIISLVYLLISEFLFIIYHFRVKYSQCLYPNPHYSSLDLEFNHTINSSP